MKVIVIVVVCIVGFVVVEHFYWTGRAATALERRLEGWRARHHLTDEQVERVRRLEKEFHGSGNPFNPPAHTIEEERAHSEALREAMNLPSAPSETPPR